MSQLRHR